MDGRIDVGPESIASFTKVIEQSKTILWNGPVGVFEMPKFAVGTKAIADAIVKATANGAFSLIGEENSVAAINQFGLADKVSYVSTGGGALLNTSREKVARNHGYSRKINIIKHHNRDRSKFRSLFLYRKFLL